MHKSGGTKVVFFIWIGLWVIRIPFSMFYYSIRYERFDYPVGADAIAIPIYRESVIWVIGAILTSAVLGLLLIRCPLPAGISIGLPSSILSWIRAVFLVAWLTLLLDGAITSIPEGDAGAVISCAAASAVLVIFFIGEGAKKSEGVEGVERPSNRYFP
jgi:hypothetical protein